MSRPHRLAVAGLVALVLPAALVAASVTLPHTFSNDTVADADQVNANFVALRDGVNAADARLGQVPVEAFQQAPWGENVDRMEMSRDVVLGNRPGGGWTDWGTGQWNGFNLVYTNNTTTHAWVRVYLQRRDLPHLVYLRVLNDRAQAFTARLKANGRNLGAYDGIMGQSYPLSMNYRGAGSDNGNHRWTYVPLALQDVLAAAQPTTGAETAKGNFYLDLEFRPIAGATDSNTLYMSGLAVNENPRNWVRHYMPSQQRGHDGASGFTSNWGAYGAWNGFWLASRTANAEAFVRFKVSKNGRAKRVTLHSLADRWSYASVRLGTTAADWTGWKRVQRYADMVSAENVGPLQFVLPAKVVDELTDANDFLTLGVRGSDSASGPLYVTHFDVEDLLGDRVDF